jgi:hypothetical protein
LQSADAAVSERLAELEARVERLELDRPRFQPGCAGTGR